MKKKKNNKVSIKLFSTGVLVVLSGLYLSGCGQKGPLYLPSKKSKHDLDKPAHVRQADEAVRITQKEDKSENKAEKNANNSANNSANNHIS